MGKTLTSIIAIGAAIAVNVIPGVGQALSAAIGSTLATSVVSAITLYGVQSAVSLVTGGGSGAKPETTETAIKTSRPPRVSAYGRSRLYGAYILYETATNGTAADVFAVHEGKIDGIETRYLSDDVVTLSGDVVNAGADGRYKGNNVRFYSTDGSVPGAGIPAITSLVPQWEGRGDGVVLVGVTAKPVKAKDWQAVYPQSTVPTPSIVARWQLCPDPAAVDPLDESGWTWTENSVRHLLHYKLVREGPKPALARSASGYAAALAALRADWWGRKIAPTLDYWIAAAEDCDSTMPLKGGGTEPRYRSSVSHKHTEQHKDPVSAILTTFDGWLATRGDGALVVYSGRFVEPEPEDYIGPEQIVSYTWDGGKVDTGEAVNEIICAYISSAHDFNTVECDAWRDESDISARGEVLSAPLEAQVPSHAQSRRLAKRKMARVNAPDRGTVTTTIEGRRIRGKRYITLHLEEAGAVFYSGPVEITGLTRNIRGGVTFTWVAASADVDAWNPTTEEGEPAATGTRVAPEPLDTPVITDAEAVTDETSVRIALTVTGPDRADITWFAHYRVVGAPVWGADEQYTDSDPGASVQLLTNAVPQDETVEVQVAYSVGDGRVSDWSDVAEVDTELVIDYDGGDAGTEA